MVFDFEDLQDEQNLHGSTRYLYYSILSNSLKEILNMLPNRAGFL